MNAADRILLRLEAQECLGTLMPLAQIEPQVIRHGATSDFGMIAGQYSIAELQDLMTLWAGRMANLDAWYAAASPIWVNKDSAAFTTFTNDRAALTARYQAALSTAQSAVTVAKLNVFTPNSAIPAQEPYNALMKAVLQCYPPDGCAATKGDWSDLYARAAAVSSSLGIAPPPDAPAQPTAVDIDQQVFASTANLDVIAQVTGQQQAGPMAPDSSLLKFLKWVIAHKQAVIIGGVAVVGGVLLLELLPVLMLPAKAAKGIAALAA